MAQDYFDRIIDVSLGFADLFAPAKNVVQTSSPATDTKLDALYAAMNNVATSIDVNAAQDLNSAREYIQQIVGLRESLDKHQSARMNGEGQKLDIGEAINYLKTTSEAIEAFYHAATSKSTIYVGVTSILPGAKKSLKEVLQSCGLCGTLRVSIDKATKETASVIEASDEALEDALKSGTSAAAPGGGGGGGAAMTALTGGAGKSPFSSWKADLLALIPLFAKFSLDVTNLSPMHIIPSAKDLNNAREQIRQLVFQTRGFGDTNREMERVYRDVAGEASRAGVTMERYQAVFNKNLERGTQELDLQTKFDNRQIKDHLKLSRIENLRINQMKGVTTSALQTANRLGMNAESVNETFMDWYQHLGLSSDAMQRIGLNMIQISRNTGVTGSRLERAMKTVQEMSEALKQTGNFTEGTVENLMQMSALAEKYGAGGIWQRLILGTRSLQDWQKLDPELQKAIALAARQAGIDMRTIWSGGLQDEATFNKMIGGLEESTRDIVERRVGAMIRKAGEARGVEIGDELDMTKLTEYKQLLGEQGYILENLLKSIGPPLGETERLVAMHRESKLTFEERVKKLAAEKQALEDAFGKEAAYQLPKYQEYKRREFEMAAQKEYDAVSRYSEAMSGGATRQALFADELNKKYGKGFVKDFKSFDFGQAFVELQSKTEKQAKEAGYDIDKYFKTHKISWETLQQTLQSVDPTVSEPARQLLAGLKQEIFQAQGVGQDPATRRRDNLLKIHNALAPILDNLIEVLAIVCDKFYWLVAAASALGAAFSAFRIGTWAKKAVGWAGGAARGIGAARTAAASAGAGRGLTASAATSAASSATSAASAASSAAKSAGFISRSATALGKIAGPLTIAIGGVVGALEAEEAGRTTAEGVGFGMLTGGAKTGSMFSGMLGVEKGSTTDKGLGVAGAMGFGALAGAAIGSIVPVIGTGIGAAVGAVIGGVAEIVKILTEGTDIITNFFGGIWDIIAGLATFDISRVIVGFSNVFDSLWDLFWKAAKGTISLVLDIPNMLLGAIQAAIVDLPMWIMNKITEGLTSLSKNEYVGAIFKPILATWEEFKTAMWVIWEPLSEAFGQIRLMFDVLKATVMEALKPLFGGVESVSWLAVFGGTIKWLAGVIGGTIKWLAGVIGYVLKYALMPLVYIFKGLAIVLRFVVGMVTAVTQTIYKAFDWLYETLVGHSIIPDLIFGIIKFFAMLPFRIMKGLAKLAWSLITTLPGMIWNGIRALPQLMWTGIQEFASLIGRAFLWIWEQAKQLGAWLWGLLKTLPGKVWDWLKTLPGKIWEAIKAAPGYIWTAIKSAFAGFGEWLLNLLMGVWTAFKEAALNGPDYSGKIAEQAMDRTQAKVQDIVQQRIDAIQDPAQKRKAIEERIAMETMYMKGEQSDIERLNKQGTYSKWNPVYYLGGSEANESRDEQLKHAQERAASFQQRIGNWQEQLKAVPETDASKATEKMAEQATKPGSIYVHDIHTEGLLKLFIDQFASPIQELVKASVVGHQKRYDVSPLDLGAFDRTVTIDEAGSEHIRNVATDKSLTASLAESVEEKKAKADQQRNIITDLNRAMDYQRTASEASEDASARLMDYSDQTQGIVSPITVTPDSVESSLERRMYGDQSASSAVMLPSMTDISEYLINSQAAKLDAMIFYLRSIDNRLGQTVSSPIGKRSPVAPYSISQGIKNIAMDLVSGAWDLTENHHSPSVVTNDGRRGAD